MSESKLVEIDYSRSVSYLLAAWFICYERRGRVCFCLGLCMAFILNTWFALKFLHC